MLNKSSYIIFLAALVFSWMPAIALAQGDYTPPPSFRLIVTGQSCAAGGNYSNVSFRVVDSCGVIDFDLWVSGVNYGWLDSCGQTKTVSLPHNRSYTANGYYWAAGSTPSISFSTWYCPAPPTLNLYRSVDGAAWSGSGGTMPWDSSLRLQWASTNATSCTGTWFSGATVPNGTSDGPPLPGYGETRTYLITCSGAGGSISRSLNMTRSVPAAPTVTISRSPSSILINQSVSVSYGRSGGGPATKCVLYRQAPGQSYTEVQRNSGGSSTYSESPSFAGTWQYRAYCDGPGGSSGWSTPVPVTVNHPAPTMTLYRSIDGTSWSASNGTMSWNGSLRLYWVSANTTSCTGTWFSGTTVTSGTSDGPPLPGYGSSRTYSLTCTGPGGSISRSITVSRSSPPAPSINFQHDRHDGGWATTANRYLNWNQSIRLYWSGSNVTYCTGTNFSTGNAISGYVSPTNPGYNSWVTYTVTCYGPGGSTSRSVSAHRYAPPAPVVTLYRSVNGTSWSASDAAMPYNGTLAFYWTSSGEVTSCTGSSLNTGGATSGTNYSPTLPGYGSGIHYGVTCTGPGGSTTVWRYIYRDPLPPAPTVTLSRSINGGSWSATNGTMPWNGSLAFYWTSSGVVSSCTGTRITTGNATSGTFYSPTLPGYGSSQTYSVTCTGVGGSTTQTRTITRDPLPPPPVANLQARNITTGGPWSDSLTINPRDEVELGWNRTTSANTTSCAAVPPLNGFSTGNAISGTDNTIDEPIGNSSRVFGVICYGAAAQLADYLTISTNGGVGATLTTVPANVDYVRRGESVTLAWSLGTNDPASCSINAGDAVVLASPLPALTGTVSHPMVGEVTFTLECIGGDSDTETVRVLAEVQES